MNYYTDVLKKYAVFVGRARRKEYWMFALWNLVVAVAVAIVAAILSALAKSQAPMALYYLYVLGVLVPGLAVGVRRLHDTNRSGWWLLISFIPFIGAIVLLVFFVQDSQPGDNQYGPNPKGISVSTG